MDPKFDKSYGRLIYSNLQLGRIHEANTFAEELRLRFNEETKNKYKEFLTLLEIENKKSDDEWKKRMSKKVFLSSN